MAEQNPGRTPRPLAFCSATSTPFSVTSCVKFRAPTPNSRPSCPFAVNLLSLLLYCPMSLRSVRGSTIPFGCGSARAGTVSNCVFWDNGCHCPGGALSFAVVCPNAHPPTPQSPTGPPLGRHHRSLLRRIRPDFSWIAKSAPRACRPSRPRCVCAWHGEATTHAEARGSERTFPSLTCSWAPPGAPGGATAAGPWMFEFELPAAEAARGAELSFCSRRAWTNTLAWLGRVTGPWIAPAFRRAAQKSPVAAEPDRNADGETIFDFRPTPRRPTPPPSRASTSGWAKTSSASTRGSSASPSARCRCAAADGGAATGGPRAAPDPLQKSAERSGLCRRRCSRTIRYRKCIPH